MDGISDPYIVQQSLKAALQLGRFHGQGSVSFLTRDRAAVSLRRLFGPKNREHFHPLVRRLSNHLYGIKGDEALLGKLAELKDDPDIINFIYSPITPQSAEEIEFDRLLKAEIEEIPDEKFDQLIPKPAESEMVEGVESEHSSSVNKDDSGSTSTASETSGDADRGWAESSSTTDSASSSATSHDRARFPSRGSLTMNGPGASSSLAPTTGTAALSSVNISGPISSTTTQTGSVGLRTPGTGNNFNFPTDALNQGVETVTQSNIVQSGLSQAQIFGRKALTNWIPNAIGSFIPIFKPSGEGSSEPPRGSVTSTTGYSEDVPKNGQVYTEAEIEEVYYYQEQEEVLPKQEKKNFPPFLLMLIPVVGFFGIFLFMDLSKSTALLPPYDIPVQSGPDDGSSGGGGGSDIASCQFTRAGVSKPIKSAILRKWLAEAAQKEGVPAAVLASVAIHENPDFVTNANDDHDAIKANKLCNRGQFFCELRGQNAHMGECSGEEIANGARTAQAVGLMQFVDVFNPGKDLCSITVSIDLAAAKLKRDGVTAQPTQEQITTAIRRYYNSCTYPGGYSYCDEVWRDYQECKSVPTPPGDQNACLYGWPTSGTITQGPDSAGQYGHARLKPREAVDIAAAEGTQIVATFDGTVASVCLGYCGGLGNNVVIRSSSGGMISHAHLLSIDPGITQGGEIKAGTKIGTMGQTGLAFGSHLHFEFSGLSLARPNIPLSITPSNCDAESIVCNPANVSACKSTASRASVSGGDYWFLLNRSAKYEILFKGVPERISQSQVIKKSRVNPGQAGRDPTPIPQKLGRRYWTLKHFYSYTSDKDPVGYEKFGPYFIALDIPYEGQNHPQCFKERSNSRLQTNDCYGPVPYAECGPSGNEQCDWGTPGEFAIHGNNRLDGEGSAGCVRHSNSDIEEIFRKLGNEDKISGTRYYIVDSNVSEDSWTDENLAGALR